LRGGHARYGDDDDGGDDDDHGLRHAASGWSLDESIIGDSVVSPASAH
jgi:hypothetical protein